MLSQIFDAVIVLDCTVRFNNICSTETVLHNKQRDLVTVVHLLKDNSQTGRINLPAPI
ncbi:hypothetical protein D3C75_1184400 [compost metagenome]